MCNFTPPETIVKIMDIVESAERFEIISMLWGGPSGFFYTEVYDGKETSVVLTHGETGESHIGFSRCEPNDVYDRETGLRVALVKAAKKFVCEEA